MKSLKEIVPESERVNYRKNLIQKNISSEL